VIDGPNAGQSVLANSSGVYHFDALAISNMNFSATASGYVEARAGTFVNGTNTINFVLSPVPPAPPPPAAPSITITSRIVAGGPGTAAQEWAFTATSNVTFTSYDWDFGDGSSSNDAQASEQHVYRSKGQFTVTVTGRRSSGGPVVGTLVIDVL
jgi:PKD repeat protein